MHVIDYKSFLNALQGNTNQVISDNFDWPENTLKLIKEWFKNSKLVAGEAFKIIDSDADGIISSKDLNKFLL